LQTVGYRELFAYLDGEINLETAVDKIKQHTCYESQAMNGL